MIKPAFWAHRMHGHISESAALLAIALLNYADDEGRFEAEPGVLAKTLFPRRDLVQDMSEALEELARVKFIHLYESELDGLPIRLGCIPGFPRHQTINRATPSTLPPPCLQAAHTTHGALSESSVTPPGALTTNRSKGSKGSKPPKSPMGGGESDSPSATSENSDYGETQAQRAAGNVVDAPEVEVPDEREARAHCQAAGIPEEFGVEFLEEHYDPRRHRDWRKIMGRRWTKHRHWWEKDRRERLKSDPEHQQKIAAARSRIESIDAEMQGIRESEDLTDDAVRERYRDLAGQKKSAAALVPELAKGGAA